MNETTRPDAPLLEASGITKRFGPVVANEDVHLDLRAGEVHALVGENGAGKTTLMRMLFGMYQPDAGVIRVRGEERQFRRPQDAIDAQIGMVHQHFMLVPTFTVAENITLGAEPGGPGLYSKDRAKEAIAEPMRRLGVDIDPEAVTGRLSVATQQKIEIVKVLYRGARVLILDEPTAVLTPQETTELFELLRRLAAEGSAIVFISHKLGEVFAVADRITVLRRGRTVGTYDAAATDAAEVVAAMTGRSDVNLGRVERVVPEEQPPVLLVDAVSTEKPGHDAALDQVSFTVRAGEILGIAGVEGNGQTALAEALVGTLALTGGSVSISGTDVGGLDVAARRDHGLGYVPEDRHHEGLPINGTVLEAIAPCEVRKRTGLGVLASALSAKVRTTATGLVREYDIKAAGVDAVCSTLSGGNQQKIVVARELEEQPACLVLAQPTRGVDLGAIEYLYGRIAEATARGCAVLLVSADLDEILRLSDRVLVMYRGRVVAEKQTLDTTREELGMHMMGATTGGAA
ncbi:ATP-binding cassette domain-containing protein [Pimelobacter simplex]|uniref:ABC transporter ATP-binding protein n=1 Tax=Nocardioides simplex TaxID=2045 RepID=A0A0A1DSZ5_NOCSI|nr:ABC transporter ATP-binding protein [Pimelobacter simplex]AIY19683.2 ABC transporter ATP-binding protein [Pimelobacter simplex]MCG8150995.1 ATP-binding cassette domain-containing protein [Pimelobacter simplex]GEB12372.1 sugar ABC transporter ATP-binding protein [Pimelobacter simplex]SFM95879.1 nucleoside ABC transporter ATP-binding protein [Pimelobacter simplex]